MENRQFGLTVAATSIAFLLVQLDVSIINVALATIGTRLQTGVSGLQWVVDAYAVTFAALLLSAGGLGDRIGARRMFMLGLVVFTAASALCGLAPGAGSLIAARALQGCGAAALVPGSLALLNLASNADPARRAWGVGLWTAAGSVGLAVGPLLGGVLIALLGWRSIFLVNLPIGLAGLWLTGRFVALAPGSERPVDWGGQVVAIAALLAGLGSGTPYPAMLPGLLLLPAGIGITVLVMTASLLGSVPEAHADLASGALNAVRQAGGAIGVAVFGGLATRAAVLSGTPCWLSPPLSPFASSAPPGQRGKRGLASPGTTAGHAA